MATDDEFPTEPAAGRTGEALARIPYEPLLPVEKRLIAVSLLLGVLLLALLVWVSYAFFPPPTITAPAPPAPAASAPR